MQSIQRTASAVFALTLAALIPFLVVKGTEPSGHAVLWILCGVLIASALIWAVATVLRRRDAWPRLDLQIDGVMIGERDDEAALQPTVNVGNASSGEVAVYSWQATLEVAGLTHVLRQVVGQDRLMGSVNLPFLHRMGPLKPGQTHGLLQFAVPGLRQAPILAALDSPSASLKLRLDVRGKGRRKWHVEADLRALAAQKRASVPASVDAPASPRPPLFEASRDSQINASDMSIVGNPDFTFATAEDKSRINVTGTQIFAGPVPPTTASSLTNEELRQAVTQALADLRALDREIDRDFPRIGWLAAPSNQSEGEMNRTWNEMQTREALRGRELERRYIEAGWPNRLGRLYGDLAARGCAPPRHAGMFALPRHRDIDRFEQAIVNLQREP